MTPNLERYRHHLTGFELTPEEEERVLITVWGLVESSVDSLYGVHPLQRCQRKTSQESEENESEKHLQIRDKFLDSHWIPPHATHDLTAHRQEKGH